MKKPSHIGDKVNDLVVENVIPVSFVLEMKRPHDLDIIQQSHFRVEYANFMTEQEKLWVHFMDRKVGFVVPSACEFAAQSVKFPHQS